MTAVRPASSARSARVGDSERKHTATVHSMKRSVLVTGGAGGLGRAVVQVMRDQGWRVVAPVRPGTTDRLPPDVVPVEADLGEAADVAVAISAAAGEADAPLRAVINLAGGYAGGGLVHETPIDDFEAILRANLRPT